MIVNTDPRHSAMEARALASVAKPLDEHELAWESVHTGGGCMCWETICDDAAARIWICDEGNGLGDETSELWLVGLHPYGEWNDHWQGEAPTLEAALNLAVQAMAARAFALGFQPNAPLTFREFVASGRDVPNVGAVTGESENEGPGRVYADGACYIDGVAGDWSLTLHNWTATGSTLDGLERRLYEFAAGEGYLTPRAPAPAPVPQWQREFPDFPAADMPAIPAGWYDASWHNDASPSFGTHNGLQVYIETIDPAGREIPDWPRFNVNHIDQYGYDGDDGAFGSDDWSAVLKFVSEFVTPAPSQAQLDALAAMAWEKGGAAFEADMSKELAAYAEAEGLTLLSADEMHAEATAEKHRSYLWAFMQRWEAVARVTDAQNRGETAPQTGEAAPAFVAIPYSGENVEKLATAFFVQCEAQFSRDELALIRAANRRYADEGKVGVCATHDFADANMIMLDAFEDAFGRKPALLCDGRSESEIEADLRLWNDAWSFAVARDLMGAPVTSTALRRAAVAARDMLAAHMTETFGPDESAWRETVFWSAYSELREALS